jgi:hypothetical protein
MKLNQQPFNPNLILPLGTQVITRFAVKLAIGVERTCGTLGIVVNAPSYHSHCYRVQFPDGSQTSLRREELSIRKHWQE